MKFWQIQEDMETFMMDKNAVENKYFNWLADIVKVGNKVSYRKLLAHLHKTEFVYKYADSSRASDGEDLRYRFYNEIPGITKADLLYLDSPCSMLEMMIALAIRCEETIMDDPRYGNRTKQWFWNMTKSLGLNYMNDYFFDRDKFHEIMDKFSKRDYKPDGEGGLFTIRGCCKDLRKHDIWTQLCWYLDSIS